MPRSRCLICLIAVAVPAAAPLAALAESVVSGRLMTDTGRPVAGYPVIVEGEAGQFVAVTDAEGGYALDDLPDGSYTVAPAGDLTVKQTFTVEQTDDRKGFWQFLMPRGDNAAAVAPTTVPTIELRTAPGG